MSIPMQSKLGKQLAERAKSEKPIGKARAFKQLSMREHFSNDERLPPSVTDALTLRTAQGVFDSQGNLYCEWCDFKLEDNLDFCPGFGALIVRDEEN